MLQYLGELHTNDNKVKGLDKKESTKKEEKQGEKKKWTMKKVTQRLVEPYNP